MKAAVLTGIKKIELCDVPIPPLKNKTDVLLKVKVVGLCGSDIHYYSKGRIGDQVVQYPFSVGHECAAVVEKTGKEVTQVKPGDPVVVDPAVSCGECDQCSKGRSHTCRHLSFLGCPGQREGSLSGYIVMPQENCYLMPDSMTLEQGVLVEPLSIGLYALDLMGEFPVKKAGILGSGPIGLSVLLGLKARGIPSVYATDKISERLDTAGNAGADWTGNPKDMDITSHIMNHEPLGLDVVFECCGDPDALDTAVDILKPGGKLMIIGIPETHNVSFEVHKLRRKEIRIQNVRRQNNCIRKAINWIKDRTVDVNFMATHRFRLKEAQRAFEVAANYRDGVIKAMVYLD
jgi:L-iditol 2-dehydrogenase